MSVVQKFFGDPTTKILKKYQKSLDRVKQSETTYKDSIQTIDDVQKETARFQSMFEQNRTTRDQKLQGIESNTSFDIGEMTLRRGEVIEEYHKKRNVIISEIKFDAFALHRRACEIVF